MEPLQIFPIQGIREITEGSSIPDEILCCAPTLADGDVLVIASKIISKAEGRVYRESDLEISPFAAHLSKLTGNSPAYCELVLRESAGILRTAKGVVICKTHHGFVLANAGVDASNAGGRGNLIALPKDPDASARKIRAEIFEKTGKQLAVIISDTFGRAWRVGQTDLAIGVSGISPIQDWRGKQDADGRPLSKTCIAIADELACAADLVCGKAARIPAAIIRGAEYTPDDTGISALLMDESKNLFK